MRNGGHSCSPPAASATSGAGRRVVAGYDFAPESPKHVVLDRGSFYEVLDSANSDWWLVRPWGAGAAGPSGYVPANRVLAADLPAAAQSASPAQAAPGQSGVGGPGSPAPARSAISAALAAAATVAAADVAATAAAAVAAADVAATAAVADVAVAAASGTTETNRRECTALFAAGPVAGPAVRRLEQRAAAAAARRRQQGSSTVVLPSQPVAEMLGCMRSQRPTDPLYRPIAKGGGVGPAESGLVLWQAVAAVRSRLPDGAEAERLISALWARGVGEGRQVVELELVAAAVEAAEQTARAEPFPAGSTSMTNQQAVSARRRDTYLFVLHAAFGLPPPAGLTRPPSPPMAPAAATMTTVPTVPEPEESSVGARRLQQLQPVQLSQPLQPAVSVPAANLIDLDDPSPKELMQLIGLDTLGSTHSPQVRHQPPEPPPPYAACTVATGIDTVVPADDPWLDPWEAAESGQGGGQGGSENGNDPFGEDKERPAFLPSGLTQGGTGAGDPFAVSAHDRAEEARSLEAAMMASAADEAERSRIERIEEQQLAAAVAASISLHDPAALPPGDMSPAVRAGAQSVVAPAASEQLVEALRLRTEAEQLAFVTAASKVVSSAGQQRGQTVRSAAAKVAVLSRLALAADDSHRAVQQTGGGGGGGGGGQRYTLQELQAEHSVPLAGVDPARKERSLVDGAFEEALGCGRDAFDALPKWKQQAKKRAVGLF